MHLVTATIGENLVRVKEEAVRDCENWRRSIPILQEGVKGSNRLNRHIFNFPGTLHNCIPVVWASQDPLGDGKAHDSGLGTFPHRATLYLASGPGTRDQESMFFFLLSAEILGGNRVASLSALGKRRSTGSWKRT